MYTDWKLLGLMWDTQKCSECGATLTKDTPALWNQGKRIVACLKHAESLIRQGSSSKSSQSEWSKEEQDRWRETTMNYDSPCCECGETLPMGTKALWSKAKGKVACLHHKEVLENTPLMRGIAGGSMRKWYDEEHEKDVKWWAGKKEDVVRGHPWIYPLLLLGFHIVASDPDRNFTHNKLMGLKGEEAIGLELDRLEKQYNLKILHDRLKRKNSKSNIDHIAITSVGVFVIDTKNYNRKKKITINNGWIFGEPPSRLWIGNQDHSDLLEKVLEQVRLVKETDIQMPVVGILAFHHAKFRPLLWKPKEVNGVLLNPHGIRSVLKRRGLFTPEDIQRTTAILSRTFPAAG